jgi:hypothetical protein
VKSRFRSFGDSREIRQTDVVQKDFNVCAVTLRVVGGDEKGSLKCETVIDGLKSQGTRTREKLRWQGPAAHTKDRPVLSSERAPYKNKTVNCHTSNKDLVVSPRRVLCSKTDWPADRLS